MRAIAILSRDPDVAARLRTALEGAGFETETARLAEICSGELDLLAFFEEHAPDLVIYEVAPPFPQGLTLMRLLQSTPPGRQRRWLLAAADREAVVELLGPTDAVVEVPAPGADAAPLVETVRRELAPRRGGRTEAA
jgi:CheY-like chemotaxis protein